MTTLTPEQIQIRKRSDELSRFGRKGGKRSLATMTPEQRHERAKKAVRAREAKRRGKTGR